MKLNIRNKLLAAFGLMIVMMVGVFAVGNWGLNTVSEHTTTIVTEDVVEDVAIRELEVLVLQQIAAYEDYIITEDPHDLDLIAHEIADVHQHFELLEEMFAENPELLALTKQVELDYAAFVREGDKVIELVQSHATEEEIIHELHLLTEVEHTVEEELEELAHKVELHIEHAYEDAQAASSLANRIAIGFLIGATIVGLGIAFLIARSLSNRVNQMVEAANQLAEVSLPELHDITSAVSSGDLTKQAHIEVPRVNDSASDETGELGRAFNSMADQIETVGKGVDGMIRGLRDVVGNVTATAINVAESSQELAMIAEQAGNATQDIAEQALGLADSADTQKGMVTSSVGTIRDLGTAIEQISHGTKQQVEGVDSTAKAVSEVSVAIDEVAKNAEEAAAGSRVADDAASKGLAVVEQTVDGMEQINNAVRDVAERIGELGTQSAEIGKIIAVIDDIAAQTNLLALNAAIEAARAGEQGRGFAVVADEVRQLAERVTTATAEITALIDGVQNGVSESVAATQVGTEQVKRGTELADEAGKSLNEIQQSVLTVSQQVEMISTAAAQVSTSSNAMVQSIESVSAVTEQTTASAEEMAANNSDVQSSMSKITEITEESSNSLENSSAATEELSSQIEEIVSASTGLDKMSGVLKDAVSVFKLDTTNVEKAKKEIDTAA